MMTSAQRRWQYFRSHRRGYWSLWIFSLLLLISLLAEVWSNDRPLLVHYKGEYYFPLFNHYAETTFGGDFDTEADYLDHYVQQLLNENGNWAIYPLNPYNHNSINYQNAQPNPVPPSAEHWLGTDDRGRDILARLVYGFRLSVLFGLLLTMVAMLIGIVAGALQGYLGGKTDLFFQRFTEIWNSLPELYLLIIFASIFEPGLLLLLILLSLFGWMGLADYVRAEFLKGRQMEYIRAAQALGLSGFTIMYRHLLPNAMIPVLTFLPFRLSSAVLMLTSLDFLGLGVPSTTPSLGELLSQGKENLSAWWISVSTFSVLVGMLILLVFIGEALRESLGNRHGG